MRLVVLVPGEAISLGGGPGEEVGCRGEALEGFSLLWWERGLGPGARTVSKEKLALPEPRASGQGEDMAPEQHPEVCVLRTGA